MKRLFLIPIVCAVFGCTNTSSETINIREELKEISRELDTYEFERISKVCTERGLNSLISWSDSLRNKELIQNISTEITSETLLYSTGDDSVYDVSIDKGTYIGDNVSSVTIIVENGKAKIDGYQEGSVVR